MEKILFLLAPSEWKNEWWEYKNESLTFSFKKPLDIWNNVTEKDLKCKWERFEEGKKLNANIDCWPFLEAIHRYTGVVFNAINYLGMSDLWKRFLENNILITSWMYGIIKPLDIIWNYKLPIDSKWLHDFWWDKIVEEVVKIKPDYIVNLLPISYAKLLWLAKCRKHLYKRDFLFNAWIKIINVNFLTKKDWEIVKLSHWVKKYRGEFIKKICENNLTNYEQFWWEIVNNWEIIDVNILIK